VGFAVALPTLQFTHPTLAYSNDHPDVKGSHNYALASVMYDVLNRVAVDSVLSHARAYEVNLAIGHLEQSRENDLLLYDRNYASYLHIATLCHIDKNFVVVLRLFLRKHEKC